MPEESKPYEAMYIVDTTLDDDQIAVVTEQLKAALDNQGAEFISDDLYGRRRLAYRIDDRPEGIYRIMYFRGTGAAVDELKNEMLVSEQIIRGTVVVANPLAMFKPKVIAPPAPAAPAEAASEVPAEEAVAEPEAPEVPAEEAVAEPEVPEVPAEEAVAEPEAPEVPAEEVVAEPEAPEVSAEEAVAEPEAPEVLAEETAPEVPEVVEAAPEAGAESAAPAEQ